ncbi:hypothetical protein [Natrononativus amylolyticus]|uniref:hypothetical protein n=1 Tax=Natrononativus amylolyticus TaxID=2963434 RepID=UPI0020CC883A|nr:hypothetical protein [Natrononativus amylolyticus]
MSYDLRNEHGILAIDTQQAVRAGRGNGVIVMPDDLPDSDDCLVELGDSGSVIDVDVLAGAVQIDDNRHDVDSQQAILDDNLGEDDEARQDVIMASPGGNVEVLKGERGKPVTYIDNDGNEQTLEFAGAPHPPPPSTAGKTGVPLAIVWVPAGASNTEHLDADDYVSDRRVFVFERLEDAEMHTVDINATMLEEGDVRSQAIFIPGDAELVALSWGVAELDNATRDDWTSTGLRSGVHLEFVDPTGNVVESTEQFETGSPIFDFEANGSTEICWLRLWNDSGTDIEDPEGLSAQFHYEIR